MTWAETGLKWFERVIGSEVGVELCGDSTFQYFKPVEVEGVEEVVRLV